MTSEIQEKESPADPWSEIAHAFAAARRTFLESLDSDGSPRVPRTDVTDTGKSYKVIAEIPGIPKDKLDVRVHGTTVEIRGENANETEEKDTHYLHRERTYSSYYRAFEFDEPVVAAEAKAKVADGVLELELPKQNPTPTEQEVKVAVA